MLFRIAMRATAVVLALAAMGCSDDAVPPSQPMRSTPVPDLPQAAAPTATTAAPGGVELHDVEFVDAERGWVAGDMGILVTFDGGRSWQSQYEGVVHEFAFSSDRHGWAISRLNRGDPQERLLTTLDGGVHWRDVGDPPGELQSLVFVTPEIGWALASDPELTQGPPLIRTADGGRTWTRAGATTGQWQIRDICFEDSENGWAMVQRPGLAGVLRTTDGALTWSESMTQPHWGAGSLRCGDGGEWANFWCCAASSHSGFVIFRSDLDGATWSALATNVDGFPTAFRARTASGASMEIIDDSAAWISGRCSPCQQDRRLQLFLTADRGTTWEDVNEPPLGHDEWSIAFADRQHGWIASTGGKIFATTDGGASWQLQYETAR